MLAQQPSSYCQRVRHSWSDIRESPKSRDGAEVRRRSRFLVIASEEGQHPEASNLPQKASVESDGATASCQETYWSRGFSTDRGVAGSIERQAQDLTCSKSYSTLIVDMK